jgi:hypothetical protein
MMSTALLAVRQRQLLHEARGLGAYLVPVLLFVGLLVLLAYRAYASLYPALALSGTLLLSCLSIHVSRNDLAFVRAQVENPEQAMRTEYIVFSLPFTLPALLTQHWYCFPLVCAGLGLLSGLKVRRRTRTPLRNLSRLLPASSFEWISGIRSNAVPVIALYLAALALSWLQFLPLFLLWVLGTLAASFYLECEPLHILRASDYAARRFLSEKLLRGNVLLLLWFGPVILINVLVLPAQWYIPVIFALLQHILLSFAIVFKYSLYAPGDRLSGNTVILAFASLSGLVPFLLPVPLCLGLLYYPKAIRNLNAYLHD